MYEYGEAVTLSKPVQYHQFYISTSNCFQFYIWQLFEIDIDILTVLDLIKIFIK